MPSASASPASPMGFVSNAKYSNGADVGKRCGQAPASSHIAFGDVELAHGRARRSPRASERARITTLLVTAIATRACTWPSRHRARWLRRRSLLRNHRALTLLLQRVPRNGAAVVAQAGPVEVQLVRLVVSISATPKSSQPVWAPNSCHRKSVFRGTCSFARA